MKHSLEYVHEKTKNRYRIRRSDWPSDCFDLVSNDIFLIVKKMCTWFDVKMVDLTDVDD